MPSQSASSIKTNSSANKLGQNLEARNIHVAAQSCRDVPTDIQELITRVTTRQVDAQTPDAKRIARLASRVRDLPERDALRALDNLLGFPDELTGEPLTEGAQGIRRTYDRQWVDGCIPHSGKDVSSVERIPSPKPDVEYGYTNNLWRTWDCHLVPSNLFGSPRDPWCPWLLIEWKSQAFGGNLYQAEMQAVRDGCAAVNAMLTFIKYIKQQQQTAGPIPIPASHSAVFLGACDGDRFKIWIHWHNSIQHGNGEEEHWETTEVARGDLDRWEDMRQIRSVLINIREWAMGDRCIIIKAVMGGQPVSTPEETQVVPDLSISDQGSVTGGREKEEDEAQGHRKDEKGYSYMASKHAPPTPPETTRSKKSNRID